jgi:hypothetical protein
MGSDGASAQPGGAQPGGWASTLTAKSAQSWLTPSKKVTTTTIEKLTSYPESAIKPLDRPDATELKLPPADHKKPIKVVLHNEPGGRLDAHTARFKAMAQEGGEVEVRSLCQSACTLILAHIPRERLCFGAQASLNFHKASNLDGTVSETATAWMFSQYPPEIKGWLVGRGGPQNLKQHSMWKMTAADLWQLGYRRCPGE